MNRVMTPRLMAQVGARLLFLQARWDPARMQGPGFAFALDPWLVECWSAEPEELLAARRRHLGYFNTHPIAAWLVAGIVCRQEAAAAATSGASREEMIARISPLKASLGASLAALYDSFFWGALRPASALAGMLAAQTAYGLGSPRALIWAAATAIAVYNIPAAAARIIGFRRGLSDGERVLTALTSFPAQTWIRGLRSAAVGGALTAFVMGAALLGGGERLTAGLVFTGGLILTWRGVPSLVQVGFTGIGGMAAAAAGFLR